MRSDGSQEGTGVPPPGVRVDAADQAAGQSAEAESFSNARSGQRVAGLSVSGALVAGAVGLVGALVGTLSGNFIGGGVFLLASAVAFGALANAIYRR